MEIVAGKGSNSQWMALRLATPERHPEASGIRIIMLAFGGGQIGASDAENPANQFSRRAKSGPDWIVRRQRRNLDWRNTRRFRRPQCPQSNRFRSHEPAADGFPRLSSVAGCRRTGNHITSTRTIQLPHWLVAMHRKIVISGARQTADTLNQDFMTMTGRTSPRAIGALSIALVFTLISACASGPNIRSDYDSGVDFSQYKTYNFFSDAGPDSDQYQSLFTQYMITAIDREMQKRGYERSNSPDLLVNFNAILKDKTKVTTSPSMGMSGGYYGYRGGYYDPWGGYGMATETRVSQYTEGTYNIDLVDAKRKQLVWEAVGVGRIKDDTFENLQQKVNDGVPLFFANYPFVAGSSTPVKPQK